MHVPYISICICFLSANRKSGSNRSDEVLSLFRGLLNPVQVSNLIWSHFKFLNVNKLIPQALFHL